MIIRALRLTKSSSKNGKPSTQAGVPDAVNVARAIACARRKYRWAVCISTVQHQLHTLEFCS
eukprot:m.90221 g.90221  ORF g.90221 m.90221 type:complete len:62 (+) comp16452_c0_seq18:3461-3646(+)